jgi:UDP-3-O-[3-hydroxymyristoyl] glucosamine N-acyltransferase
MKLSYIAECIGGQLIGVDQDVSSLRSLDVASTSDLTILLDKKYLDKATSTKAIAIVSDTDELPVSSIIKVNKPRAVFAKLVALFYVQDARIGVSKMADISASACIGKDVYIDSFVKVDDGAIIGDGARIYSGTHIGKDSVIGNNTVVFANVSIYHEVSVGNNCIIHSGAVLGADGFGFEKNQVKEWEKVSQIGKVIIGDDVEIGANTCVDRGCLQDTIIMNGVKLDNLIQIAHNCFIGKHSLLSSVCAIAGSTTIGDYNLFAGDVGTAGHVKTGNDVTVMARAGITKDIPDGQVVRGFPAGPQREVIKEEAILRRMIKERLKEKVNDK